MAFKQWIGDDGTGGNNITIAGVPGSDDDAFNGITLATTASFLTYGSTNPPFSGMLSARAQATSGADRVRWYHSFSATDTLSGRFYFRNRSDPGAANILFAVIEAGTFAQRIDLRLVTVSGVRKLQLWGGNPTAMKIDFGAPTFGTAATNIYRCEWTVTKGTTASNGTLKMKIFDSTGAAFGSEYTSTATDTGTAQYVRPHWGGNSGVPMDMDVWAIFTDDTAPGYYPGVYVVPAAAPSMTVQSYEDYVVVVSTSVAGSGGTLAHTASPTTGVIEPRDGVFLFPRNAATGADYTAVVTVTESPSGQIDTATAPVPKLEAGGNVNITAPRVPSGTVPGNTWI